MTLCGVHMHDWPDLSPGNWVSVLLTFLPASRAPSAHNSQEGLQARACGTHLDRLLLKARLSNMLSHTVPREQQLAANLRLSSPTFEQACAHASVWRLQSYGGGCTRPRHACEAAWAGSQLRGSRPSRQPEVPPWSSAH